MKKLIIVCMAFVSLCACTSSEKKSQMTKSDDTGGGGGDADIVYICTGPMSKCYHNNELCRGLQRCSGEIEAMTIERAEEMGRRPCEYCY